MAVPPGLELRIRVRIMGIVRNCSLRIPGEQCKAEEGLRCEYTHGKRDTDKNMVKNVIDGRLVAEDGNALASSGTWRYQVHIRGNPAIQRVRYHRESTSGVRGNNSE